MQIEKQGQDKGIRNNERARSCVWRAEKQVWHACVKCQNERAVHKLQGVAMAEANYGRASGISHCVSAAVMSAMLKTYQSDSLATFSRYTTPP